MNEFCKILFVDKERDVLLVVIVSNQVIYDLVVLICELFSILNGND